MMLKDNLKSFYRFISPKYQSIHLEYKVKTIPRYGYGKPPHKLLYEIINKNRNDYVALLNLFLQYKANIHTIKRSENETDENKPVWNNGFLPGLDIVTLYGMIATFKPNNYIEIGSGNSTKVARKAIKENNIETKIISIDPYPRANINHLADRVIREPFEQIKDNKFIIDLLGKNDILFIDNSHRSFANSDVTVCFLELLPYLKKNVIVHVHDVYLPYDYPQEMCDRFYNEQYILAAYILANPEKYKTILPNFFISEEEELKNITAPFWDHPELTNVETHGGSYWLKINN